MQLAWLAREAPDRLVIHAASAARRSEVLGNAWGGALYEAVISIYVLPAYTYLSVYLSNYLPVY